MVDLAKLHKRKLPLSYGTRRFRLVLGDSRYAQDVIALRNDQRLNRFIHHEELTLASQERFIDAALDRTDALNFVALAGDEFAGAAGLYGVADGVGEYGRFIMPEGELRRFAPAVTLLIASFGFEVLGLREIYCRILEQNTGVLRFHEQGGWKRHVGRSQDVVFGGEETRLVAMSMTAEDWPAVFETHRDFLRALIGEHD